MNESVEKEKSNENAKNGNEKSENSLGIPKAEFVEDVDKFMEKQGENNASVIIRKFDENHSKYRFMELNLMQKKKRLKKQIPDIKSSLDVLNLIKHRKESNSTIDTQFLLSDQVYMSAIVEPTSRICLWLGANVMLEYPIEEAEQLLSRNLETAMRNLAQIDVDLDFLRDQITTTEVSILFKCLKNDMARVYNWDVKRRQSEKSSAS
ncbi:prefoldin subunit 3-like protein [Dinothrombium tinctorium]|uniref:Prefoldin subunit 3 n=1 Tax=Dinothrombium tinctorium TaxID=1965070 RepID=A0A3S3NWD2_9ACAR|nr:prefoldin subunit 3-like protein [Dinothrombium tinctorium]